MENNSLTNVHKIDNDITEDEIYNEQLRIFVDRLSKD